MIKDMGKDKICTCMCHEKGIGILHCVPCCKYTYEPYIKLNGEIDMDKYNKIVQAYKERE